MDRASFDISMTAVAGLGAGRSTVQHRAEGWGCTHIPDMLLVFSELVTNAAVHTSAGSTTVVTHVPPTVRIAVHDTSHLVPALRHDARPGGFGLRIVQQLSDSWGWDQTATGKVVWSNILCGH